MATKATWNSDEIIFTDSKVAPYAVTNPDGSILIGGYFSGYLGESGLFITSHPTINNSLEDDFWHAKARQDIFNC